MRRAKNAYIISLAIIIAILLLFVFTRRQDIVEPVYNPPYSPAEALLSPNTATMDRFTQDAMQQHFHTEFRWPALMEHELYADDSSREVLFQLWFSENASSWELWAAKNYAYELFYTGRHARLQPLPYDAWRMARLDAGNPTMNLLITQIYIGDHLYLQEEHQGNTSVYHEFIQFAVPDQVIESDSVNRAASRVERLLPRGASVRVVKAITRDAAVLMVTTGKQVSADRLPKLQAALERLEQQYTRVVLQLYSDAAPDALYYSSFFYGGKWHHGNWTQGAPS